MLLKFKKAPRNLRMAMKNSAKSPQTPAVLLRSASISMLMGATS